MRVVDAGCAVQRLLRAWEDETVKLIEAELAEK
jgi:hypothetical protein